jgi:hypothetical protein
VKRSEAGSTTVAVLVLLTLLAAAAGGGALILGGALAVERRSTNAYSLRRSLEAEARRVASVVAQDPTPAADSGLDPVWDALAAPELTGAEVALQDISSGLNPNWVQKNVFLRTGLKDLLKDPAAADILQQRRVDRGFSVDLESAYGDLFDEGALEKYCTPYGYPNINITDEFALRKLYALRTGNEAGANVFHSRIQGLLIERRLLAPEQVRSFLGLDYDALYPVMNVEPTMNVNFVEPRILSELLAYPELRIPHARATAQAILDERDRREITAPDLRRMLGVPADNRIYQYFGTTTWFWRITVKRSSTRLSMVLARIPGDPDAQPHFTVVEERYERR